MLAAGWALTGTADGPTSTYVKNSKTLELTVVNDKDTEVTLSFPG